MRDTLQGRPVVFGEVLFDSFPDGRRVLGGAPFNVAWHLKGFGLEPLFISRVGEDPEGEQISALMRDWGMDRAGLQRDPRHPTGTVRVSFHGGQPAYDILPERAYDFIDAQTALRALAGIRPALLCHGSLIARHQVSRGALAVLRDQGRPPAFIDINLRAPWWDAAGAQTLLEGARWLKLNDEELAQLSGRELDTREAQAQAAAELAAGYGLEMVLVTRGEHGALLLEGETCLFEGPRPVAELVDTVGAGDAFSAVTLLGLLRGWPPARRLARAGEFAAAICAQRGATAQDPALYAAHLAKWRE